MTWSLVVAGLLLINGLIALTEWILWSPTLGLDLLRGRVPENRRVDCVAMVSTGLAVPTFLITITLINEPHHLALATLFSVAVHLGVGLLAREEMAKYRLRSSR